VARAARLFLFTFLISAVTGILFGLVPAIQASRIDPKQGLHEGVRSATGSGRSNRLRNVLVVSEVSLTCVLLVGAGLMLRSLLNLLHLDIRRTVRHAVLQEPGQLTFLCAATNSAAAQQLREVTADVIEYDLPTGKDGFLATNSLAAFLILLARSYATFAGKSFPKSLEDLLRNGLEDTVSFSALDQLIERDGVGAFRTAALVGRRDGFEQHTVEQIDIKVRRRVLAEHVTCEVLEKRQLVVRRFCLAIQQIPGVDGLGAVERHLYHLTAHQLYQGAIGIATLKDGDSSIAPSRHEEHLLRCERLTTARLCHE
jgi:hypothetical protein